MEGGESKGNLEAELLALRGMIARLKSDLEALADAEAALSDKMRAMGLDESITSVDLPTVAGLPSRRRKQSSRPPSSLPPPRSESSLKAAAIGAGLMLGVAIVVLLAINLQNTHTVATAPAPSTPATFTSGLVVLSSAPAPLAPAPAPPPVESAEIKPETGTLSIICSPRCDTVTDNGIPLSPGSLISLPVPAGPHKVVGSYGNVKKTMTATIVPGQTREVKLLLDDIPRTRDDRGF
jgi:hypothetical protein